MVKAKAEPMMYEEISKGNSFFCKKYLELLPDGDNVGDVRKRCAGCVKILVIVKYSS